MSHFTNRFWITYKSSFADKWKCTPNCCTWKTIILYTINVLIFFALNTCLLRWSFGFYIAMIFTGLVAFKNRNIVIIENIKNNTHILGERERERKKSLIKERKKKGKRRSTSTISRNRFPERDCDTRVMYVYIDIPDGRSLSLRVARDRLSLICHTAHVAKYIIKKNIY